MCRKEWVEWCHRWKFASVSTHDSCIRVAESQAVSVTCHFVLHPSRSSVWHKQNWKCFNKSCEQFVCAAVGWHSDAICDWLKLPIDYILMILDWPIRSTVSHGCFQAKQVCATQIDNADLTLQLPDVWSDPLMDTYMPHLFFGICTINSETSPGELPGWNSIPRKENFDPCMTAVSHCCNFSSWTIQNTLLSQVESQIFICNYTKNKT